MIGSSDTEIDILVKLQNQASAGLAVLQTDLNAMSKASETMGSTFDKISQRFSGEKLLLEGGLVAIGGAIAYSVKQAMSFGDQMLLIQTQAGATAEEVKNMSQAILDMGGTVTQTPEELSKGLYPIESAGLRGSQALDVLKMSAQGAMVGHADLEKVATSLTATISSGIGGITDYSDAMGQLNSIVGAGNMRMDDLTSAISTGILPAAKNFGVSFSDVGAALATMTTQGEHADESATRLRMTFALMAAPTDKAASEFKSIGLSSTQLATDMRGSGGLGSALEDLKKHLEDSGLSATQQAEVMTKAFGGGHTSAAIMTLLQNTTMFGDKLKQITTEADKFGDAVDETQKDPMTKFKEVMAEMNTISIRLGNDILPLVTKALSAVATWFTANQDNIQNRYIPAILKLITTFISITKFLYDHRDAVVLAIGAWKAFKVAISISEIISGVATAIGGLSVAAGTGAGLSGVIGALTTVFLPGLLIELAAVDAFIAYKAIKTFQDFKGELEISKTWLDNNSQSLDTLQGKVGSLSTAKANQQLQASIDQSREADKALKSTTDFYDRLTLSVRQSGDGFGSWQKDITSAVDKAYSAVKSFAKSLGASIKDVAGMMGFANGGIVPAFAGGGVVYASGGAFQAQGTDTVPAMLTPGEMVLNSNQQSNLFKQLNGGGGGAMTVNINLSGSVVTDRQGLVKMITDSINRKNELRKLGSTTL